MSKIVSVVPNISEGSDQAFISGLVEKLQAVRGLVMLDTSRDSVRNRTVFSFSGPQEAIFAGGLLLYRETLARVDMRKHRGEYPRLGAVDVFPFVPLKEATTDNALVTYRLNGKPLALANGAPVRGLIPDLYFWKSAKWITGLRFVKDDKPGYWEVRGYHNHADPWKEERHG